MLPGRRRWVILAAVVPLLVLPGGAHLLALFAVRQPEALCSRCHSMQSAVSRWRLSAHKGVKCLSCHAEAKGLMGIETSAIARLSACFRMYLTGAGAVPRVGNEACLSCHSAFYRIKKPLSCKHVPHPHERCDSCHKGLVHGVYDRDSIALAVKEQGSSLHVSADFPLRLHDSFAEKRHFQHGFMKTMGFCGRCHRMSPGPATEKSTVSPAPRARVCETCHIHY